MNHQAISIRPFIGAKNFEISCAFYRDFGFPQTVLFPNMSLFTSGRFGFYLQDAYVKDWIENTMLFMEVEDLDLFWNDLIELNLKSKYETIKLTPIRTEEWGRECFVHDPSGILWHFGEFTNENDEDKRQG